MVVRIKVSGFENEEVEKLTDNTPEQAQGRESGNNMKRVPVIVMLAMTAALLSSNSTARAVTLNPEQLTEVMAKISVEAADEMTASFSEVQRTQQSGQKLPPEFTSENIQYTKKFRMEGKQYTLYYLDTEKKLRGKDNIVTDIYMVPADYNYIRKNNYGSNNPPVMRKFIYHDLGDPENKDYCSALLLEEVCDKNGDNSKFIKREVRLPDEIANEIINLFSGETKFRILDRMANMYTEVTTP